MKKQGKVWLIGAGPSDVGLFTLKGKAVLEQAEVVVYDNLVGQGILAMMPKTAKKINVGKISGNHPVPQDEINQILLTEALAGKRVVRLKGGDPFVFGRGGEELELLRKSKIPFEIVPGVTSVVSVPAYHGIPVTHRDFCSSVHIITGHTKNLARADIDFPSLVKFGGTLVFLMGVASMPVICKELIDAGMDRLCRLQSWNEERRHTREEWYRILPTCRLRQKKQISRHLPLSLWEKYAVLRRNSTGRRTDLWEHRRSWLPDRKIEALV